MAFVISSSMSTRASLSVFHPLLKQFCKTRSTFSRTFVCVTDDICSHDQQDSLCKVLPSGVDQLHRKGCVNSVLSPARLNPYTESVLGRRLYSTNTHTNPEEPVTPTNDTGWVIRLANENGYLSWCRNTYLATVVGVGMWAEGPSSIAFHATEGALFLGGLNLVLGTVSYVHTILRLRHRIHMSVAGAALHTLAALTHLGIWLTVVVTYLGYVESEEEARHPAKPTSDCQKKTL